MTKKYWADFLFPIHRKPIRNGVVVINEEGRIVELSDKDSFPENELIKIDGGLCPGFVNTHCHMELSFMFKQIPEQTGLVNFVKHVVAIRDNFTQQEEQQAIQRANDEMWANGIAAVGDISNDNRSFNTKRKSALRFHTFVEVFDLSPTNTQNTIATGQQVFNEALQLGQNHTASITPHAPYSCTPQLYKFCDQLTAKKGNAVLSIHNQENPEENNLFIDKTGIWAELPIAWGFPFDWFEPYGVNSLPAMSQHLTHNNKMLFVHNTFSTQEDVQWATNYFSKVYWATCANANLYIENNLPNYNELLSAGAKMTIGTDSLASNWQLCILEEIKAIQKHNSQLSTAQLLKWGTLNGAEALNFETDLGSLENGKAPGLVQLTQLTEQGEISQNSKAKRVV